MKCVVECSSKTRGDVTEEVGGNRQISVWCSLLGARWLETAEWGRASLVPARGGAQFGCL